MSPEENSTSIRDPQQTTRLVDCEKGRELGCASFCCRLIVRLEEGESDPGGNPEPLKHCVDKDPDGLCTYYDREHHGCTVWEARPSICRRYSCNNDPLLQLVLRDGYSSLVKLVTTAPVLPDFPCVQIRTLDQP